MVAHKRNQRKAAPLTTDQLTLQVLSALQSVHSREEAERALAQEVTRLFSEGYPKTTAHLWSSEFARRLVERDGAEGSMALSQQTTANVVEAMYGARHGPGQETATIAGARNGHPMGQGDELASEQTREDQLYDIAKRDLLLYKDSAGMFWAGIPEKDGSHRHVNLESTKVSNFLHARYKRDHGTVIRGDAVRNVLATIQGDLAEESDTQDNFVRLAWRQETDTLYVDLYGNKAAEIDASGWRIVEGPPIYFRRPPGLLPQVVPERGGSLDTLREILGLENKRTWRLLVGFLLSAYHPKGPYPVLVLSGEQGTGKSTAAQLLGRLIDPNTAQLEKAPTREDDIPVQAAARHLLAWDNLSTVPSWFSDALCGLATTLTQSRRKLYSDADLYVFNATRPTLINGIEDLATRPDLLNRALLVHLEKMPEAKRKEREVVFKAFEEARPALLGAVFDAVSCALRNKDRIRIDNAPRMADMASWVTQAEPALGWRWGSYMEAFQQTAQEASSIALEASALAQGLMQWLEYHSQGYAGYAASLLSELNGSFHISHEARVRTGWPKQPNYLTNNLRRIAPELRKLGWEVDIDRKSQGAFVTIHPTVSDGMAVGDDAMPRVIVLDKAVTASGVPHSDDGGDGHDDKMPAPSVQEIERKEESSIAGGQAEAPNERQYRHHRQAQSVSQAEQEDKGVVEEEKAPGGGWRVAESWWTTNGQYETECPTCGEAPGSNPLTCLQCEKEVLFRTENARCRHQGDYISGTDEDGGIETLDLKTDLVRLITTTQTCATCGATFYCDAPEQHQEEWVPWGCPSCDETVRNTHYEALDRLEQLQKQADQQRKRLEKERMVCDICGAPSWPTYLCPMHYRFEHWAEQQPDATVGGDPKCSHLDIHEEGDSVVVCNACGGRWECDHPQMYEKAEGGFSCPDCWYRWSEQNTSREQLDNMLKELEAKYARLRSRKS